jgi:hypothetical protein
VWGVFGIRVLRRNLLEGVGTLIHIKASTSGFAAKEKFPQRLV